MSNARMIFLGWLCGKREPDYEFALIAKAKEKEFRQGKGNRRTAKEPRRQLGGVVGIGTLTLIIGLENVERALDIDGKNRRKNKERRK